jgi:hypothetical protein
VEATTISNYRKDGLEEVAQTLSRALESAGEQRGDYWRNRVQPSWQHVWPKSRNLVSSKIAEHLALLCIAAGDEFPATMSTIADWLRPREYTERVVRRLHSSALCTRFPEAALHLLDAIGRSAMGTEETEAMFGRYRAGDAAPSR